MMLLSIALAIQSPETVSAPLEAYGSGDVWDIRIGRSGVLYRTGEPWEDGIARYFPPARIERDGAKTVFTTRTADGQPVVLTIEPGECRSGEYNQTALRAQLTIEGRTLTGCAEDGIEDNVPVRPALIRDYFLDDGIRATGRNGEWSLGVGGLGANYLRRGDDYLDGDARSLQPRVDRRAATYRFSAEGQSISTTVRVAPCTLTDGTAYPLTVEVRAGSTRLTGCAWQGNLPPFITAAPDGGSGPELRSGAISNGDDYPASALRAGASGAVTVRYVVGANGRVTSCEVAESSGNAALDSTTCSLLQRRFRFEPARDRYGQPRQAVRSFRMVWRLPVD